MRLTPDQWQELRQAVADDDQGVFDTKLSETVRIFVSHERDFQIRCARVRRFERGQKPYLITER